MKKMEHYWWKILLIGVLLIAVWKLLDFSAIAGWIKSVIGILTPFIIGIVITFFTIRPATKLEKYFMKKFPKLKKKSARGISVALIYAVFAAIVYICLKLLLPALYNNVQELITNMPSYYREAKTYFEEHEYLSSLNVVDKVNSTVMSYLNMDMVGKVVSAIGTVASSVISFFLGIVLSVYILLERESLADFFKTVAKFVIKGPRATIIAIYSRKLIDIFYSYFTGLITDAVLIGVLTAVFLLFFGAPYAVLLGFVVAIGNMIPFFGPIVAALVLYLVCAVSFGPVHAVWVLVFQIALGQIDGNLIQPKIVGSSVGMSPFWVIFAVTLFGGLWGPAGMILGVPIVAALRVLYLDYKDDRVLNSSV